MRNLNPLPLLARRIQRKDAIRVARILTAISAVVVIASCDREAAVSTMEPPVASVDIGGGDSWTLTMYYWDDGGWVRLGAIDGGFLPADLRIGINAHNWGQLFPGFWAEFDNIRAYGDIDLPQGVIEDFDDGSIEPIWYVGNPWWNFDNDVARAEVPPGSDDGIFHIAAMDTWGTVVHGEFDVQVDFTLDPLFHTFPGGKANVMLCFWDEPYMNGICATHSSRRYTLWRGIDAATGPEPVGFHTLQKNETNLAGKLRITRTRVHKGPVVESVSGNGSYTTAQGDWRTFSFSARRHADGTVDGQWERIRREDGNAADSKSHGVVTCFTVLGNEAWIGGITTSGLYSTPSTGVAWRVMDTGNGNLAGPYRISTQYTAGLSYPAGYCATTPADPALNDAEAGNIRINGR